MSNTTYFGVKLWKNDNFIIRYGQIRLISPGQNCVKVTIFNNKIRTYECDYVTIF